MTKEATVVNAKTAKVPERRDKRYFVLVTVKSMWRTAMGDDKTELHFQHRSFGPFHKREQAADWAKKKLSDHCKYEIMHMEAP